MKYLEVLVVESSLSGHHQTYLTNIIEGLLDAGIKVFLALPTGRSFEQYAAGISASVIVVHVPISPLATAHGNIVLDIIREVAQWRFLRRSVRSVRKLHTSAPLAVIIPYLDHFANIVGMIGYPHGGDYYVGIAMRQRFHFFEAGIIAPPDRGAPAKRLLFERVLENPRTAVVFTIDNSLSQHADSVGETWQKVRYFPDPVDLPFPTEASVNRFKDQIGLPKAGRSVVLVFGNLDERKGIQHLFAALHHIAVPQRPVIILAGQMSAEIRQLVENVQSTGFAEVICIDRRIPTEEASQLFGASDAVWLGYIDHFVGSGVLWIAAKFGRRILATKFGLIGFDGEQLGATTFDPRDDLAVARCIESLHLDTLTAVKDERFHSWQTANAQILKSIECAQYI